jgi:ubiquinone/menaquinone biosynthesis C-methylase UbiE
MRHFRQVTLRLGLIAGLGCSFGAGHLASARQANETNREAWQRVPDILAALAVAPGAVIADIGAGDGFFTVRLGRAVGPTGRVYAVDISDSALARLGRRVRSEGLDNVTPVLGTPSDPKLPAGALDAALIVNAYHEMTQHLAMLTAIRAALKPSGRLVIVEPIGDALRTASRERQMDRHQIGPRFVQMDGLEAGFLVQSMQDPFTRRGGDGAPEFMVVLVADGRLW